jgi:hypothetical protein
LAGVGRRLQLEHFGLQQTCSSSASTPWPVLADTGTTGESPPYSSGTTPCVSSSCFTFSGIGLVLVDLVHRHDQRHFGRLGVVDRLDGLRHDAVVGGHHQITMSVACAPRARIAVNASWPGVSRKVITRAASRRDRRRCAA